MESNKNNKIKVKRNRMRKYKFLKQEGNWTAIANTMFKYIDNLSAFKVYCYLCYRFNKDYNYAFPSMNTIADECNMSRDSVRKAVKYLEERKFISKFKMQGSEWMNNCYYINYVVEDLEERRKEKEEILNKIEELLGDEEDEEIVEIIFDEKDKIISVVKEEK